MTWKDNLKKSLGKKKDILDIFKTFLIDKKCLNEFIENLKEYRGKDYQLKDLIQESKYKHIVTHAFPWDGKNLVYNAFPWNGANESFLYWYLVDNKWKQYLKGI